MTETLTDIELDLIHFIERFHASNGRAPTESQLNQRFTGLTTELLESFVANPLVAKSFKARGIIYPAAEDKFTPAQMHAAALMLDMVDRRSDEKKLRDIGVTTRQWAQWLLDDEFAAYLRDRSEKMLDNSVHEAHRGMMKGVRNGNIQAVKTFYEVTGRYRPNEEQEVDVRRLLHTFIEVIQRYIKDPVVMHQIAMDLSQVASAESYSNGLANQMMSGATDFRTRTITSTATTTIPAPPSLEMADDE